MRASRPVVLPYVIRYADPRWWVWRLQDLRRWARHRWEQ